MTSVNMRLATSQSAVPTATIAVDGRLDALTAPELRAELSALTDQQCFHITIDLHTVEFVDSAGLAALVSAMKSCRLNGGDVLLVRPESPSAFRVFELTKFDSVFEFVTNR